MDKTVSDIIEDVKKEICQDYCKYAEDEKACEEKCPDCPLTKLG